jgi:tetratricopeptide (TPR) repeat protein
MYELLNVMRGKGWIDRSAGKEPPALIAEGNEQKVQSGPHRLSTFLLVGFKREALLPLAPFLVIGAVFALLATKSEGPVPFDMPLISRPLIAASAIWFYLLKIIWPMNLMYIYPRWDAQVSSVLWWAPLVCVFLALAALYAWRQKIGGQFLWGLANFAVPLLPAIGLVKFGFLRLYYVADHFLYISMMGISLCISLVFLRFAVHARRLVRHATICIGLAYVVLLICQTWNQASTWKDPMTLWADNVKRCPSCSVAYNMLGYSLAGEGGYREAIPFYWKALQINPDSHESHNNLGTALFALGDTDKAIEQYRIAIRIRPDYVDAYYNLGNSMIKKGNIEEAAALYRTAIRINPDFAAAHNNLANALSALGKKSEAMKHYRTAIRLKPDFAEAYNNLGDEILRLVDQDDAPHRATEAKVTEPDPGDIVVDAGVPETKSGKLRLAKRYFEKALEIDPDQARARANLEIANSRLREISQADETGGQGKR